MRILELSEIHRVLTYRDIIDRMRAGVIAYSRGECEMPMPMHLAIDTAEVHMKSSYRRGGRYFALKIAGTFPRNAARGLPTGNGMMLLSSAETGEPVAFLADGGYLTDVRTAAVAALAARELGRADRTIGILGTGIQARLQAQLHRELLPLQQVWIWGRTASHAEECCHDLERLLPGIAIARADSPQRLASETSLIITATASRQPLLTAADLQPRTHLSAVGADSPGNRSSTPRSSEKPPSFW